MSSNALIVSLELYVDTYQFLESSDPDVVLADGSIIQIIGSATANAGSFQSYGDAFLADTTTGDDVILATSFVGAGGYEADSGYFGFVFANYDITAFPYIYIRFFNTNTFANLMGNPTTLAWGTSAVFQVSDHPIAEDSYVIYMSQDGPLVASETGTFTVIPEPSSISFFALVGGMTWAMRTQILRRRRRDKVIDSGGSDP